MHGNKTKDSLAKITYFYMFSTVLHMSVIFAIKINGKLTCQIRDNVFIADRSGRETDYSLYCNHAFC